MATKKSSTQKRLVSELCHVVLPPVLPGKRDNDLHEIENAIHNRLQEAAKQFRNSLHDVDSYHLWDKVRYLLEKSKSICSNGAINRHQLINQFASLEPDTTLILHVEQQNAGLLIRRCRCPDGDNVTFEAFEASPTSAHVLAATGALQWDFLSSGGVAVPYSVFNQDQFQEELALFLERASSESIKRFASVSKKAGTSTYECRDPVDPAIITTMLMTLLEALGTRVYPPATRKRIRDDVVWSQGAELPWRRSPRWLVLRLGLLRHLIASSGQEAGQIQYKCLMCIVLLQLQRDSIDQILPLDMIATLRAKLARRLAKLEDGRQRSKAPHRSQYDAFFDAFSKQCDQALQGATDFINSSWKAFKTRNQKVIPILPYRPQPTDLVLSLRNSSPFLTRAMDRTNTNFPNKLAQSNPKGAEQKLHKFAKRYFDLSELEENLEVTDEQMCGLLSERLNEYLDFINALPHDQDSEQSSIKILNAMEVWTRLDKACCLELPLLEEYHPLFLPESLDVLVLPSLLDMERLKEIQDHLANRIERCNHSKTTIFDDPARGCFAEKYFDESPDSSRLQDIYRDIQGASDQARAVKESEWQVKKTQFETYQQQIAQATCLSTTMDGSIVHDDRGCTKCYLRRVAHRMRILVHEDYLPVDATHAKAVIFELCCPPAFVAYRNITWRIATTLAGAVDLAGHMRNVKPKLRLSDYDQISKFSRPPGGVNLASTTKSFLTTHYRGVSFPTDVESVCRPSGLKLRYYNDHDPDDRLSTWTGSRTGPLSFAHLCRVKLPLKSSFAALQEAANAMLTSNGPSSNEVIAHQMECPVGLNVHEYMAFQNICSGIHRRWANLLVELSSSNLNFSKDETTMLVRQVVNHVGPGNGTSLRRAHQAFLDPNFCSRLEQAISERLEVISTNWREHNNMEILITLLLRLISLGPESSSAMRLLLQVRSIALRWTQELRKEIHSAQDADSSRTFSQYALWAALLGRRTFAHHLQTEDLLEPACLRTFVECSVSLQDNFNSGLVEHPLIKCALIRDLKMVYKMRHLLQKSLQTHTDCLTDAIDAIWPQGTAGRVYTALNFGDDHCVELQTVATTETKLQTIRYNWLEGSLLIDNEPLGRLPVELRGHMVLTELFGNQSLLIYPSPLHHMMYVIALRPHDHEVHIGFRNGELIVQAHKSGVVLEFVHRSNFVSNYGSDLPGSLLDNCVHWLNVSTATLETRQKPDIWFFKSSNWTLDLRSMRAWRRGSTLVNPSSSLFAKIASIFEFFEEPRELTVYQAGDGLGNIHVELPRLQLNFQINRRGRLFCHELQSIIDPNQDALTWYGLVSKLVLQDVRNPKLRSIITPLGDVQYKPHPCGTHVIVALRCSEDYGRFFINETLGRVECAAEPRLVFVKTMLHAYTSMIVPDPLTGRTGTEEAIYCLNSGTCRPWTTINPNCYRILEAIANLIPVRGYYPGGMKVMEQVGWDPNMRSTIQHDGFLPPLMSLYASLERLSLFSPEKSCIPALPNKSEPHLRLRGQLRRQLYERRFVGDNVLKATDLRYNPRDNTGSSRARSNVFEATILLNQWSAFINTNDDIGGLLQCPTIGGFETPFECPILSDLLQLDIASEFGALVSRCVDSSYETRQQLYFLLGTISFREDADMDLIRVLIAFAVNCKLKDLAAPVCPSFSHFRMDVVPSVASLVRLIEPCGTTYTDPLQDISNILGAKLRSKMEKASRQHEKAVNECAQELATHLMTQWPCPEPSAGEICESDQESPLLDVDRAMALINPEWLRLFQNSQLSAYLHEVQKVLDAFCGPLTEAQPSLRRTECVEHGSLHQFKDITSIPVDLLRKSCPGSKMTPGIVRATNARSVVEASEPRPSYSREMVELNEIIVAASQSRSTVQQRYAAVLSCSLEALKEVRPENSYSQINLHPGWLPNAIGAAWKAKNNFHGRIIAAMHGGDSRMRWLTQAGILPCLNAVTILEQLRSTSSTVFGTGMREAIIDFALSITTLQRLNRIEAAHIALNAKAFREEWANEGHENWNPFEYPDWLLLEIEADILIRPTQVEVACATIQPSSGSNSVLQMNMGQGKTSVIIPMVVAVLADTRRLVRVVVPRALLLQTAQLMQARLGGLLGRKIQHVPFSRKTSTATQTIQKYYDIHNQTMASAGVMITLPEHIMSFMLGGLQRLSDAKISEARSMIKVQEWVRKVSRDVLDECDALLAVRTQLIYPSGQQSTIDGHPHRWETAQMMLRQVQGHLWSLKERYPQSIEILMRSADSERFPMVFFLRGDVEDALLSSVVDNVISGQTEILQTRHCTEIDRHAMRQFITAPRVEAGTLEHIGQMSLFRDSPAAKNNLYLLRGLVVHRILLLVLKKRWNVQYGLHPDRDPMAVPYRAKGVPSDQAEWGHPDVAILLTCLSFYFGGLAICQIKQALRHLEKSDDPSSQYYRWTQSAREIPNQLRDWNVINVDDEMQLSELWNHLRFNMVVIDYFLNNLVFPKHAKQFNVKLQASGWDVPLVSLGQHVGKRPKPLTTGFSGTNDNRTMLPLTIKQEDLAKLAHTSAEVLTYLLLHRNRGYIPAVDVVGKRLSEEGLLNLLQSKDIRILIDAGAHILEMDNKTLARQWLKVSPQRRAALYFDKENRARILYRTGKDIPLVASPFADDLSEVLVYLDESHCRGTDLKLPPHSVAALTLGLGQTKDHTVQAAMRMRQLATTQSVIFVATPDVHQSILDQGKKPQNAHVDSRDVISWLIEQTCTGIEQLQPLYYSQGIDFCRRTQASMDNPDFIDDETDRKAYISELRQREHQKLIQLYNPRPTGKKTWVPKPSSRDISAFSKELEARRKGFQDFGGAVHGSALQEVEQEREEEQEVEAVREVQKPIISHPLPFLGTHRDIIRFAETGRLPAVSAGYEGVLRTLRRTTLGKKFGINVENSSWRLLVSVEYLRTVNLTKPDDNFLRPANWVLWAEELKSGILITPEETEELIPIVLSSNGARTHILSYSPPLNRKMLVFNDLTYYAMPSLPATWKAPEWLKTELSLFGGRLFFEFNEYDTMCRYMGLADSAAQDTDESNPKGSNPSVPFTEKPTAFIQEWLSVRRKGQDFTHTPMGYMCNGKPLPATHPFFAVRDRKRPALPQQAFRKDTEERPPAGSEAEEFSDDDDDIELYDAEQGTDEDGEQDTDGDVVQETDEGGEQDTDE